MDLVERCLTDAGRDFHIGYDMGKIIIAESSMPCRGLGGPHPIRELCA